HAKMEEKNLGPVAATELAMQEISGAIIAITLVMAAVFVPVAFMSGPVGLFYRQFSSPWPRPLSFRASLP
ncbi:MAG TPA: efflux RND transporter permease subunit, partial [Cyclobacteriaceae bacterium]|nr:efflux RND transporter permease subunit [Cyclobacteriaceae bacterium]